MAFVRIKKISGKEYGYLVTNSWTGSGPRQKVAKYLGRIIRPAEAKSEPFGAFLGLKSENEVNEWITKNGFGEIAAALIRRELANYALSAATLKVEAEKVEILDDKGRAVAYALNDGFLCSYTARKLIEYEPSADYSGYDLADALTAAGIAAEKEVFISVFGKMQALAPKKQQTEKKAFEDFYY
jgi:hypothetical protein